MIDTIQHGEVRELRLNRPPVNALDPAMFVAIRDAVRKAPDDGCRAIVLSGREGLFSAGLDIPALLELNDDEIQDAIRLFFEGLETLAASPIPIAAAITGHSPAGGAVLSIFCDWRVMADGEFGFGFNEVAVGIAIPSTIHAAVAYAAGARRAEMMCVTGRIIGPREAMALGLVDWVAQPDDVVSRAVAFCEELLTLPQQAMLHTRTIARKELVEFARANGQRDAELFVSHWKKPETQASLHTFVDRLKKKS